MYVILAHLLPALSQSSQIAHICWPSCGPGLQQAFRLGQYWANIQHSPLKWLSALCGSIFQWGWSTVGTPVGCWTNPIFPKFWDNACLLYERAFEAVQVYHWWETQVKFLPSSTRSKVPLLEGYLHLLFQQALPYNVCKRVLADFNHVLRQMKAKLQHRSR